MIVGSGITVTKERKKPQTATPNGRQAVQKNNTTYEVSSPSMKKDESACPYVGSGKQLSFKAP